MPDIHLEKGSSNCERRLACPGSVQLSRGMPNTSSVFANAGTACHFVMEEMHLLEDGDPIAHAQAHLGHHVSNHTLNQDDIAMVVSAWQDGWLPLVEAHNIEIMEPEVFATLREDVGGTGDIVAVSKDQTTLIIGDYKFGKGHQVFAKDNAQLLFLAMCVIYGESSVSDLVAGIEDVVMAIIQPNDRGLPVLRSWRVSMDVIVDFKAQHDLNLREVEKPGAALALGDHCKFCPARTICPEQTGAAHRALLMDPEDLGMLTEAMALVDTVEGWASSVRVAVKEQLEAGAQVPGYKLVLGQNRKRWALKESELFKALQRKLGKKNMVEEKLLSPAQMIKMVKASGKKVDLDQYIETYSTGLVVAPEDSPKPAANPQGTIGKAFARLK